MALTEDKKLVSFEINATGFAQIKEKITVYRDGQEIASNLHLTVLRPGDDVSSQSEAVQQHCAVAWTPEVVAAYEAEVQRMKEAAERGMPIGNPPVAD